MNYYLKLLNLKGNLLGKTLYIFCRWWKGFEICVACDSCQGSIKAVSWEHWLMSLFWVRNNAWICYYCSFPQQHVEWIKNSPYYVYGMWRIVVCFLVWWSKLSRISLHLKDFLRLSLFFPAIRSHLVAWENNRHLATLPLVKERPKRANNALHDREKVEETFCDAKFLTK